MNTKIREFRKLKKFTQEELAKKVRVTRYTIILLEKGNCNPTLRLAHNIAEALNSNIYDVFDLKKGEKVHYIG